MDVFIHTRHRRGIVSIVYLNTYIVRQTGFTRMIFADILRGYLTIKLGIIFDDKVVIFG